MLRLCDKSLTLEVPIGMLSIEDGVSPKWGCPPPSFSKDGFKRELLSWRRLS